MTFVPSKIIKHKLSRVSCGSSQSELILLLLRTVLTIVTAHTFCAYRDTRFPMGGAY